LSPIDEQALSRDLQLGRTPIREALQRLASDGLVFQAPRRGLYVSEISLTDLQKIFEARMVLEGLCARLAAQRATPSHLAQFEALMQELRLMPDGDSRLLMDIDERFHSTLYDAADNEFLADALRRLHAFSFRLWHVVLDRLGDVRPVMDQHIAIAEAIKAGDGDAAERILRQHISEFHSEIKAVV
jgi:DNA-binding GntR family transcriptional regulator